MALDEPRGVDPRQELEVAAPRVRKDHREAVEVVTLAVLFDRSERGEVDLSLDARRGLVADDRRDGPIALERADKLLDGGVAAAVPPFADLLEEADSAQVILAETAPEVVGEGVDGTDSRLPRSARPGGPLKEEGVHGVAVHADLTGNLADG